LPAKKSLYKYFIYRFYEEVDICELFGLLFEPFYGDVLGIDYMRGVPLALEYNLELIRFFSISVVLG
jgi:hypothetical protein